MSDNPKLATSPAAVGGAMCDPKLFGPDDDTDTDVGMTTQELAAAYAHIINQRLKHEDIERRAAVRVLRTLAENNRFRGCKFQDIMEFADRLERGEVKP
jgi:hypothetical protein